MWEVEIIKSNARKRVDESVYFDNLADAKQYYDNKVRYFDGMFINSRYNEVYVSIWNLDEIELIDSRTYKH